jgi:hypothetical protein
MYDITAPGGVYINYDVVGPDDKDQLVHVALTETDGENPGELYPPLEGKDLAEFLRSLSTKARFHRFVKDFRAEEGDQIDVSWETIGDIEYAVLRHADLCDFLAKKDYVNSWHSEMHERFCFWEYGDWVKALSDVGFEISDGSEAKQNPWLIEHRFAPAAKVFIKEDDTLKSVPAPVTNALLIAKKPL